MEKDKMVTKRVHCVTRFDARRTLSLAAYRWNSVHFLENFPAEWQEKVCRPRRTQSRLLR